MSHPHQLHATRRTRSLSPQRLLAGFLTFLWLPTLSVMAQTVYRCGDQYSTHPSCSNGSAPSVHDPRSTEQQKNQDRLTHQTQAEAQRLEKQRIKTEQAATRAVPPSVAAWSTTDVSPHRETMDSNTLDAPHPHAGRKKTGAYFTAKDRDKPSKKTSQPKLKPKANADTPDKP